MRTSFVLCFFALIAIIGGKGIAQQALTGNVIFIHPDGSGASMWGALRLLEQGPDGMLHWDRMERLGLYRGHQRNSAGSTSHAGATTHAFGVKVDYDTFGHVPEKPVTTPTGRTVSIMTEAIERGIVTGLINSGHLAEPGTAVFVAGAFDRASTDTITAKLLAGGVDVIMGGGENLLLPAGQRGRHGGEGVRKDGRNLIEEARAAGYTVIFTRDELLALPDGVEKLLGVFAAKHTFNDMSEEELKAKGLPLYQPDAPTVAEMTAATLNIFQKMGKQFILVVEEEGSDNFANDNNAIGALTALSRANEAIGVALEYIARHPETLLLTAADSDAGGMEVYSVRAAEEFDAPLPTVTDNGSPLDGMGGTATLPFTAAPDAFGTRLRFGIAWACEEDVMGAIVARAHGLNAEHLPASVDNTEIYRLMYRTLFGKE
ncbi:MAG: alkaline phosphatase [Bacteroidia bacterium]|nr:alkaline phosphatase [Bacteroidia bacterium]